MFILNIYYHLYCVNNIHMCWYCLNQWLLSEIKSIVKIKVLTSRGSSGSEVQHLWSSFQFLSCPNPKATQYGIKQRWSRPCKYTPGQVAEALVHTCSPQTNYEPSCRGLESASQLRWPWWARKGAPRLISLDIPFRVLIKSRSHGFIMPPPMSCVFSWILVKPYVLIGLTISDWVPLIVYENCIDNLRFF